MTAHREVPGNNVAPASTRPSTNDAASPWWTLVAVECGNFAVYMDGFIVTLALPAMAREFGVDTLSTRASFKAKDLRGFAEFMRQAGEHDAQACAHLAREVMSKRLTVQELETKLRTLRVPTLIAVGDQDAPCVEPSMMMRALIPHAGLVVFPACGHTPNIEEPGLFNLHVAEFLAAVECSSWAGWRS